MSYLFIAQNYELALANTIRGLPDVYKKIKELRLAKGVTQEQAYNDTGVHFGRIEQGKRDVALTTLVKLADYFEVGLGDMRS